MSAMNELTKMIMIGGFLGSGKTTLMNCAADLLAAKGIHVGLITNDQATALVDTGFLKRSTGAITKEVSGSCFCCNFPGLEEAVHEIASQIGTGIILAEPVGSCTDLSATVIQPLKDKLRNCVVIAPISVLVDPVKLEDILAGGNSGLHRSSAYIVSKQLEEADLILINKIDSISAEKALALKKEAQKQYPHARILLISALNGTGVEEWLNEVISSHAAGTHLIDVDYDTYAEGEAVLGWLNTTVKITDGRCDWLAFARDLLAMASDTFTALHAPIGHVKLLIEGKNCFIAGNLTGGPETISVRGTASTESQVELTFNARVQLPPMMLEEKTKEIIRLACEGKGTPEFVLIRSLSPGRPNPTFRYDEIIS